MAKYNSLNVKSSNSQLNELKSAIKNNTEVVLTLSSNMIGSSDDETNFPHKFLLTNRNLADIKLSKSQFSKMIQSGKFLGRLFGPLFKNRTTINKKCN